MKKQNKTQMNWEKISGYIGCLTLAVLLWTSLNQLHKDISDVKERIAKLEVKVEKLEEKI